MDAMAGGVWPALLTAVFSILIGPLSGANVCNTPIAQSGGSESIFIHLLEIINYKDSKRLKQESSHHRKICALLTDRMTTKMKSQKK